LVSGASKGLVAVFLRLLLWVASQGYSTIIGLRNFLYSKAWLKIYRSNAVVISIGNITVGGTGKTPLVIWLCKKVTKNLKLKTQNYSCAVLTRGYKTEKGNVSDEVAVLAESYPQAKVVVNPDRVAGAAEAVAKFSASVLIMDDGFQHRRLHRGADIVTIDAMCPFGYGKMLPAGLLREPVTSLRRADAVVITRCDQISESELSQIQKKLQLINPDMLIARSIHSAVCAKSTDNKQISPEELKNKKIFAFCGIGNPDAFLGTVKRLGCDLVGSKIYDDHHHYTDNDIADIYEEAGRSKADLILTTQKDWFSTQYAISNTQYEIPFAYLAIELKFIAGEDKITKLIEDALAGKIKN
jgi:tetraacyldisaccharide 4'-kinase